MIYRYRLPGACEKQNSVTPPATLTYNWCQTLNNLHLPDGLGYQRSHPDSFLFQLNMPSKSHSFDKLGQIVVVVLNQNQSFPFFYQCLMLNHWWKFKLLNNNKVFCISIMICVQKIFIWIKYFYTLAMIFITTSKGLIKGKSKGS